MRKALAGLGVAALVAASLFAGSAAGAEETKDVGTEAFGQPVLNEIATRGPNGPMDQVIEIVNPSMTQFRNISNWQVVIYDGFNNALQTILIPAGTVLAPLGAASLNSSYWTIGSPLYSGGFVDQTFFGMVDVPDNGGIALFNPGLAKVDGVAFSPFVIAAVEGQALVPQSSTLDLFAPSYGRDLVSTDINNNNVDFKLLVTTPDAPN